jgi:endonuclease/exonuclease/phosphatase family metal-dependent hydrolase
VSVASTPAIAARPSSTGLRVATYNVHRCIGRDGRLDVARCVRVIEELDADVVGLQEVDANHRGPNSGEALLLFAETCGYRVVHGVTLQRPDADYGNALLYRGELCGLERHDISVPGPEPRGLIAAELAVRGTRLRVYVTHLGLRARERRVQSERVDALVRVGAMPAVLLADANEWRPFVPPLRRLQRRFGRAPAPASFPSGWPLLALDRIWAHPRSALRGLRAHRSPLSRVASDHLPVIAELAL